MNIPLTKKLEAKTIKRFVLLLLAGTCLMSQGQLVLADTLTQQDIFKDGINWYDTSVCTGNSSSNQAVAINPVNVTYTDSSRGGRRVAVTVYVPQDNSSHPLIMFAPGRFQNSTVGGNSSASPVLDYSRYLNAIAAQGFVVAGANFSDNNSGGAIPADAQDIKFLITQVEKDSRFKNSVNINNGVGVVGHSDGAMVALLDGYDASYKDSRIKVVLAEDGDKYGSLGSGPPLLLFHGTNDQIQPDNSAQGSIPVFNTVQAPYVGFAQFKGADHWQYIVKSGQFSDAVDKITGQFLKEVLGGGGSSTVGGMIQSQYSSIVSYQSHGNESSIVSKAPSPSSSSSSGSGSNSSSSPSSGSNSSGSSTSTGAATGPVYLLGDSILGGAYFTTKDLQNNLNGANLSSSADASVGRALDHPGSSPQGNLPGRTKSGLDAITADQSTIAKANIVVLELGTNASSSVNAFQSEMQQAVAKVKSINSSATIYWVNLFSHVTQNTPDINKYNQIINSVASSQNINVIDTTQSGISLSSDGIHPDSNGYKKLSDTIANAIKAGGQAAQPNAAAGTCCGAAATTDFGTGTLPSAVPDPYNKIFTAAAANSHMSPALLAAIFYGGENGNHFPNPNGPWAVSPTGAQGPFQFEPYTWPQYAQDGNGDGKKDPNNLADASFAAADMLSSGLHAQGKTDEATVRRVAWQYNEGPAGAPNPNGSYANNVWAAYQKFGGAGASGAASGASTASAPDPSSSGGSCASSAGSAADGTIVFPLKIEVAVGPSSWTPDMGVDISTKGGACGKQSPEFAMGNGTIVGRGIGGFGPDAPIIHITDTQGRIHGRFLYYGHAGDAQSSNGAGRPSGTDIGGKVSAGQIITYTGCGDVGLSTGPHIEIGIYPQGATSPGQLPGNGQTSGEMMSILKDAYKNGGDKGQQGSK